MAADEAQMQAVQRLEALEHEAAELAQRMAGLLQAALMRSREEAAEAKLAGQAARAAAEAVQQHVRECQEALGVEKQKLAAAQQQWEVDDAGSCGSQISGNGLLALQQRVAAAEERVRLAEEAAAQRRQLRDQAEAAATEVAKLGAARAAAAAELAACQQAQRRVAADLQLAESAADAAALRASVAADERRLASGVAAKQAAAGAAASHAEQLAAKLEALKAEVQCLTEARQAAGMGREAVAAAASLEQQAMLRTREQQLQASLHSLRQQEQRLTAEAGALSARMDRSAGSLPTAAGPDTAWRPLHHCFSFRKPENCSKYIEALTVLAGSKLRVLVADSLETAGHLLESVEHGRGGGTRIWPLDSLAAPDHSQSQRRAASAFPAGGARGCLEQRAGSLCVCASTEHASTLHGLLGSHPQPSPGVPILLPCTCRSGGTAC